MENNNYTRSCEEELVTKLLGSLTQLFPELEFDMQKQLEIRKKFDLIVYNYTVTTKETKLIAGDILQKADLYLNCKKLEGCSPRTLQNYKYELQKFGNFFNKPVTTLTSMDLRIYMANMGNVSARSVNTKMSPIRDFFAWMQNEEYIISNPAKKIKPVKEPQRERVPLTDEQVELIRDYCNNAGTSVKALRGKALFEFLLATGCRVGEVPDIKYNNVDFTRMTLLVIGKGNKERRVYFTSRVKIALTKYLKKRKGNSEYLFCSNNRPFGKLDVRALQKIINDIGRNALPGVRVYPHIFRHTFATKALKYMDIDTLRIIMGHTKIDTTLTYAKISQVEIESAYNKINF